MAFEPHLYADATYTHVTLDAHSAGHISNSESAFGSDSRMTVQILCAPIKARDAEARSCPAGEQVGETEPFISELLGGLTTIIQDLETHQIHMFYETVGLMIGAETVPEKRDEYLVRSPNSKP